MTTYQEFIDNILETRGRFACGDEYHERHHIVPKCMGGTNDKENLIDLFAREHFEAHRLLALENPENEKLVCAWWMMAHINNTKQKECIISADEYEKARKAYIDQIKGEKNYMYGKYHSKETKKKMSDNHADVNGKNHPNSKITCQYDLYMNIINVWDYAKQASDELGIRRESINACCRMKIKTTGGFIFRYLYDTSHRNGTIIPGAISLGLITENEAINKLNETKKIRGVSKEIKNNNKKNHKNSKIVCQYDLNMNLINIWGCVKQAIDILETKKPHIGECCFMKRKTAGGFIWRYLYDSTHKDGTVIPGAITLGLTTEEEALKMLRDKI